MSETYAGKSFWRKVTDDLWWSSDRGSVYRLRGQWWGLNAASKETVDPFVGPFETPEQAMDAYDRATGENT